MTLQARILDAQVSFHPQQLLRPLILSSGAITELTEARVQVTLNVDGREAVGRGSIYLSDLWSWPDPALAHAQRETALHHLTQRISKELPMLCGAEPAHPLELGLRLHDSVCSPSFHSSAEVSGVTEQAVGGATLQPPALAQAMCLSPFDAAIHDAAGQALQRSAFSFYEEMCEVPSADEYFPSEGAIAAIRKLLRAKPQRRIDAWYLVGKDDDMEADVAPWARDRGYWSFKIKILGRDADEDARRTAQVFRAARRWNLPRIRLSVDSNESHPDAQSVLDYLLLLRKLDADAFNALAYLEQPTGRDIIRQPVDWCAIAKLKPILLDEGLTSLELLPLARRQNWSGLALKTCKGHSFTLVAAAWASQHGMMLSLQDLTNPGYAAIHSLLLAEYIPTINGVELNSPQFTPEANRPWLPRLAGVFDPHGGIHELPSAIPSGLGSEM